MQTCVAMVEPLGPMALGLSRYADAVARPTHKPDTTARLILEN
jgi:hypothetical protein